jgi:hypothetical protein
VERLMMLDRLGEQALVLMRYNQGARRRLLA